MADNKRGLLVVLSGPSGVGKSTIAKMYLAAHSDARFSVSATTREKRRNEIEGKDYFFKTMDEFQSGVANERFAEYAEVFGHFYGTPKEFLENTLGGGEDVVMDIDVNGAAQLMKTYPEGIFVFIAPPSIEALKTRLRSRARENEEEIQRRLKKADEEISHKSHYDYEVINDDLDRALSELESIVKKEKNIK